MFLDDMKVLVDGTPGLNVMDGGVTLSKLVDSDSDIPLVALYETPGIASEFTMGSEDNGNSYVVCDCLGLQVYSRADSYEDAKNNIDKIYKHLNGKRDFQNTEDREYIYLWIKAMQPPFHLGIDYNIRNLVACNFMVYRSRKD